MGLVLLDSGASSGGASQNLVATITGSASVSASLKAAHTLAATSTGVSVVTISRLDRIKKLSADINCAGTVTADLSTIRLTASPVTGISTVTSSLVVSHVLSAHETGTSVVSATLTLNSLGARIDCTATVSATKITSSLGLRSNSSDGKDVTIGSLGVFHTLAAVEHGLGTITSSFNVLLKNSTNVIAGQSTVFASLGRRVRRSALSNLSIISEYRRIVGILMLVDPSFQIELSTPPTAQTFTFVKKVVKGLFYADIQVSGSTITCQVKTGDGQNANSVIDVSIRTVASGILPPVIAVTSGVLKATGFGACWVQTTSSGSFSATVTGIGPILVEVFPKQGVAMSAGLNL
jgi:hypothetical protein